MSETNYVIAIPADAMKTTDNTRTKLSSIGIRAINVFMTLTYLNHMGQSNSDNSKSYVFFFHEANN